MNRIGALPMLCACIASGTWAAKLHASEPVATASETTRATEEPKERLVCKREKTVGSFISKRVCRTERQARDEREASQEALRDVLAKQSEEGVE